MHPICMYVHMYIHMYGSNRQWMIGFFFESIMNHIIKQAHTSHRILTLVLLFFAVRGNLEPAVVVGLTRGDCSTLRSLAGAVAASGDAARLDK